MTKTRGWTLGTALLCVLLAVAAWFLLVGPKRAEAADLRDQKVAQDAANSSTRVKIQQLKAQYAELPAKQAELAEIQQQMPMGAALPSLVRSLTAAATSAGVTLNSVSPGTPALFESAATTSAAQTATTAAGSAAAAASPAATASTATAAGTQALVGIPTTVVIKGTYAQTALFLQKVQAANTKATAAQLSRAYLVQGVQIVPLAATGAAGTGGTSATATPTGQVTVTISGQVFVLRTGAIPTVSITPAT